MTYTIRLIDPATGTSQLHNTATLAAAFFLIQDAFDKRITISDEDGNVLTEILPMDTTEPDALDRVIREFVGD